MFVGVVVLIVGLVCSLQAVNLLRPRRSFVFVLVSWIAAWFVNELAAYLLLDGVILGGLFIWAGALDTAPGVIGIVLLALACVAIVPAAWSSLSTRLLIEGVPADLALSGGPRYPWLHVLLPLLSVRRGGVRVEYGRVYGEVDQRRLRMNVYRSRSGPPGPRPAVINVHGGAWVMGTRFEQALPLLNHLAVNGWVAFNIDYRLSPRATMPEPVQDVKRAIAYVREHAEELGVDPGFIALTGGSAGGHLTALAALTPADESLQPGFESSDASVQAAVPFYGLYDLLDEEGRHHPVLKDLLEWIVVKARADQEPERFRAISPRYRVHPEAPPFLIAHGSGDTLVPVAESRAFARELRAVSQEPVLYAEMKGGQHAFEVFATRRSRPLIEAVERFLAASYAQHTRATAPLTHELA